MFKSILTVVALIVLLYLRINVSPFSRIPSQLAPKNGWKTPMYSWQMNGCNYNERSQSYCLFSANFEAES